MTLDSLLTSSLMVFQPSSIISGLLGASMLLLATSLAALFWSFCKWLIPVEPQQPQTEQQYRFVLQKNTSSKRKEFSIAKLSREPGNSTTTSNWTFVYFPPTVKSHHLRILTLAHISCCASCRIVWNRHHSICDRCYSGMCVCHMTLSKLKIPSKTGMLSR